MCLKISLGSSFSQVRAMKLFINLRREYEILGVSPVQNVNKYFRQFCTLFFQVQLSITAAIYLFVEAKTIQEYADSFYAFATTAATAINIFSFIWNMENIFNLIQNLEKAIAKQSLQEIYNKLNGKIEKFSSRLHFTIVQCTLVGVVMPTFVTTIFFYFVTDSGRGAFRLPFLAS